MRKLRLKMICGTMALLSAVAFSGFGLMTKTEAKAESVWASRGTGSPVATDAADGYQKIDGLTAWGTGMYQGAVQLDGTKISFYSTDIPVSGGGHEMFGVAIGNTSDAYPSLDSSLFTASAWTRMADNNGDLHVINFGESHATATYHGGEGVAYADALLTDNTLNDRTASALAFSSETTEMGVALSFRYQASLSAWEVEAEITHGALFSVDGLTTTFYVPDEKILGAGVGADKQVYISAIGFYDGSPSGTAIKSYFKVEEIGYDILFDANGGTGEMQSQHIAENGSAALSANTFINGDKIFIGWATSPDGPVVYKDGATYAMGTEGTTLYAKWLDKNFANSSVSYIQTSGEMTVTKGQQGFGFSAVAAGHEVSALISTSRYTMDGFSAQLSIENGFTVDGAQIVFALKDAQEIWERTDESPVCNGVYVTFTRTGSNTLSYAVYLYKTTSVIGGYALHQRGETVENVPYNGEIAVTFENAADGVYTNLSVNGVAFEENIMVNEWKNVFTDGVSGYMLVQALSNGEALQGSVQSALFPIEPEDTGSDDGNGDETTGGGNANDDATDGNDTSDSTVGGCKATASGVGALVTAGALTLFIKKKNKKR
ncbi:MAG: InlB B-repeat-containing protein [Clostridia bacterium]|nr:InlB B-repeat-containing protein [Clostridia bacterium]